MGSSGPAAARAAPAHNALTHAPPCAHPLQQAKDTLNDKRTSGSDVFRVTVVSADGKYEGISRVRDLANGQYEVHYTAPTAGLYHIHVAHNELGTPDFVPIRGSPFAVTCTDPWTKHRVVGATPARRKGATVATVGSELVLYGGDRSGVSVLNTDGAEWRWSPAAAAGKAPADRTGHSLVQLPDGELVVFGGVNLADQNDLNDVHFLRKHGEGWAWSSPTESQPYARCAQGLAGRQQRKRGTGLRWVPNGAQKCQGLGWRRKLSGGVPACVWRPQEDQGRICRARGRARG
jgi:dynein heavy chain